MEIKMSKRKGDNNWIEMKMSLQEKVKTESWLWSGRETPTTRAPDWLRGEKKHHLRLSKSQIIPQNVDETKLFKELHSWNTRYPQSPHVLIAVDCYKNNNPCKIVSIWREKKSELEQELIKTFDTAKSFAS